MSDPSPENSEADVVASPLPDSGGPRAGGAAECAGADVDATRAPAAGTGPWKLRGVRRFLQRPAEELYEQGFFDAPPEEIRIRLRVRDAKVEMVVYAVHQGRLNEITLPFAPDEVFAELCG